MAILAMNSDPGAIAEQGVEPPHQIVEAVTRPNRSQIEARSGVSHLNASFAII